MYLIVWQDNCANIVSVFGLWAGFFQIEFSILKCYERLVYNTVFPLINILKNKSTSCSVLVSRSVKHCFHLKVPKIEECLIIRTAYKYRRSGKFCCQNTK